MVAVMMGEPQRGVRAHGRLIDSRDLYVGESRALPSRPMPERGHHRCCQPAPTMIRIGSRSTRAPANPRCGGRGQWPPARDDQIR